jgi:hypothetical protein
MFMTWVWIYAVIGVLTTAITFVAARRLGDRTRPVMHILFFSMLAGALWPVLLLGAAELSSVVAYSTAESWLGKRDPESRVRDVVVTMR